MCVCVWGLKLQLITGKSTVCNEQQSFYAPATTWSAPSGSECMLLTTRAAANALVMWEPVRWLPESLVAIGYIFFRCGRTEGRSHVTETPTKLQTRLTRSLINMHSDSDDHGCQTHKLLDPFNYTDCGAFMFKGPNIFTTWKLMLVFKGSASSSTPVCRHLSCDVMLFSLKSFPTELWKSLHSFSYHLHFTYSSGVPSR